MRRGSDVRVVAGAAATLTWGEFDQDGEPTNETTGTAPTVTVTRLDGTTVSTGSATDATTHWSYDLTAAQIGGPLGRFLCAFATTPDSLHPDRRRCTQHMWEIPDGLDRDGFARWVLARLLEAEQHEACEFLQIDGQRPFWPNHQDDGSPYDLVGPRWEDPTC